jgi:hypothetical protein
MGVLHNPSEASNEHPMTRMLRMQASPQLEEHEMLTPRTRELLARFQSLPMSCRNVEEFTSFVKNHAPALVRGFNAEELADAAKELDAVSVEHEKNHDSPNCPRSRALRAVAAALRGVVHTQLA